MGELMTLRGIGPATEEILNERGIVTLRDLAEAHPDQVRDLPAGLSFIVAAREALKLKPGERRVNTWHPKSPYAGHPVPERVRKAVEVLARRDEQEGKPPLRLSHVLTYKDYGERIVLSTEPGGKREVSL